MSVRNKPLCCAVTQKNYAWDYCTMLLHYNTDSVFEEYISFDCDSLFYKGKRVHFHQVESQSS